jgi:predicted acetyltransferase
MKHQRVALELAGEHEEQLLRNLMQAYGHDLSEFDGSLPDEIGSFGVGAYFEEYWREQTRFPYKIMVDVAVAGFALVREFEPGSHSIAEFFALRPYRRDGVGKHAAWLIFDLFEGEWHIAQDEGNLPAQAFWRGAIGEYTDGNFSEAWSESQPRGPKQVFRRGST